MKLDLANQPRNCASSMTDRPVSALQSSWQNEATGAQEGIGRAKQFGRTKPRCVRAPGWSSGAKRQNKANARLEAGSMVESKRTEGGKPRTERRRIGIRTIASDIGTPVRRSALPSAKASRADKSALRRDAILAAALEEFSARGFA